MTEPTESLGDYDVNKMVDPGNFDVTEGGVGLYARRDKYENHEDPIDKIKKKNKKQGKGPDSDPSGSHRSFDSRSLDQSAEGRERGSNSSRSSNSSSSSSSIPIRNIEPNGAVTALNVLGIASTIPHSFGK